MFNILKTFFSLYKVNLVCDTLLIEHTHKLLVLDNKPDTFRVQIQNVEYSVATEAAICIFL